MIPKKLLFVKKFAKSYFGNVDMWLNEVHQKLEAKLGEKLPAPPDVSEIAQKLDEEEHEEVNSNPPEEVKEDPEPNMEEPDSLDIELDEEEDNEIS